MDQIQMQQTVMENTDNVACGSLQPPLNTVTATAMPPTAQLGSLALNGDDVMPSTSESAQAAPTYDELFPALPSSGSDGTTPNSSQTTVFPGVQTGSWGVSTRSNDSMRIQSSQITQVFHVAQEKRAKINNSFFGETTSPSICADITKRTGAHIEISTAKDNSLSFVVTGKQDAVAKARKLILEKFQAQNIQNIQVPKEHHKILLGKRGKRLQELETMTSTKITVPGMNDSSDFITIIGCKEAVDRAIQEIRIISDEQLKHVSEVVTVPKLYHPFVCGGNNMIINSLSAEYGVRISVPPLSIMSDDINIIGDKESILKVKEIILKTYKDMEKQSSFIGVEVNKNQHKYVVGQKGSNIAEILTNFNVSVEVPSQESPTSTITLRGPPEKLAGALTVVYEKAHSQVTEELSAPMWLHRYIIGKKGANINKITEEFPQVHIELADAAELIKLDGPRLEVCKVKENLETMIAEMMSRLKQETITIDPKYHKHIIGKSGSNINRIRNETNVFINFDQNGGNVIRLEGAPEAVETVKQELLEMVKKLENEKERDINIEYRLHGLIIGNKGEKIKEIRDQFNQVQISFPDHGQKSDVVKIRGPKEEVDACYKYMQKFVKQLYENNYQVKVSIFKQFLKFIIGKGGVNINKIRSEMDVRIDLATADEGSDEVVIIGRKENCEKAKERLQQIQDELANITEMDIIIPAKFHNSLIGQGGKLIRSISEECGGVSIKFPPMEKKSDKVTIRGPKEDVIKAKKQLIDLSNEKQLASFSAEVRCKLQHHRFLIGKNGAAIRKVRDETGARIIFPSDKDDDKEVITIIGRKEQVAAARKALESTIKELDNIVEDSVSVPSHHHLYFIQRRGEMLKQIGDQFGGVRISFPRNKDNDLVVLKGGVECVAGAKERILEIVKELESQVTIEVFIPQHYHRTVMGQRGSNVQDIIKRHNVEIKFPERASAEEEAQRRAEEPSSEAEARPCDIVRVKGSKENCEGAKADLLSRVPVTLEIEVPYKFHSYIIGPRGATVRQYMNQYDVNIQMPPAQDHSDVVKIIGPPDNVDGAKAAILDQVKTLEEGERDKQARNFQLTLNVDPEFHPKIIGKKGATISKMRDKYGVNIKIPQRNESDPSLVTIIGYEEKCKEAKDAIMKITGDLANQVKLVVDIPNRFHARLIGQRGKTIRKIMDEFKVIINLKYDENSPDSIQIIGSAEQANACQEHLLNLAEEYQQDLDEMDETRRMMSTFSAPRPLQLSVSVAGALNAHDQLTAAGNTNFTPGRDDWGESAAGNEQPATSSSAAKTSMNGNGFHMTNGNSNKEQGFVVAGAPWEQEAPKVLSSEDFPSMAPRHGGITNTTTIIPPWGPRPKH